MAHGTDGAGSVRVPASFCGVVGLKPTRGLVSFGPDLGDPYFGTSEPGIITRSVRDLAAALDVMVCPEVPGATWAPSPSRPYRQELQPGARLRVALSTVPPMGVSDPECSAAAEQAARTLAELGHSITEATPDWMSMLAVAGGPMSVPGAASLVGLDQLDLVEPRNRPMIERLASMTVLDHAHWIQGVRTASRRFCRFWEQIDLLVTPTCGVVAPSTDWAPWNQTAEAHLAGFATFPNFAQPFNLSGQPALSLPLGVSASTGMPIGVQLVGRHLAESTLLNVGAELEAATPWAERVAPFAME